MNRYKMTIPIDGIEQFILPVTGIASIRDYVKFCNSLFINKPIMDIMSRYCCKKSTSVAFWLSQFVAAKLHSAQCQADDNQDH